MTFEHTAESAGRLSVSPVSGCVTDPVSVHLTWTCGEMDILAGGCVRFQVPQAFCDPQVRSPLKAGYCTAECEKPGVTLSLAVSREGHPKDSAYVTIWGKSIYVHVLSGTLSKGDQITLRYGQCASGDPQPFAYAEPTPAPFFSGRHFFSVAVDPDGQRSAPFSGMLRSPDLPEMLMEPGPAVSAAHISSLRGHAEITFDQLGNPVETQWSGTAKDTESSIAPGVLFGDMHCHSMYSDGLWTPEDCYRFARDVIGLDFCAVTDHVVQMSDDEWQRTMEANRLFHKDGEFLTLNGYELNYPGIGDKNLYYPGEEGPLLRDRHWGTEELIDPHTHVERWLENGAIMMSHLHAGNLTKFYVPELCRLVEIYSNWGCCECQGAHPTFIPSLRQDFRGQWAQDALAAGWHIAFTGNSDDHMARPGWSGWHRVERVYRGGLTAVYTDEPTRKGLFDALKNRRTYATSGSRIRVEADMNGFLPGSKIASAGEYCIRLSVSDPSPILSIELISGGQILSSIQPQAGSWQGELRLSSLPGPCYLRIRQQSGHTAWTSPWYPA